MTTRTHRKRNGDFLASRLVRLVTEAGPGGVSTRGLAAVLGMNPGRIQRTLLYCAQCGRIVRLRRGTPGHTGTSAVWAPASL